MYSNVHTINNTEPPKLSKLQLTQYDFKSILKSKICVSSNSLSHYLAIQDDRCLWHNTTINPKQLFSIIDSLNWVKLLSNLNTPIAFILKEESNYYLFRNSLAKVFFNKELCISTKQFEGSKLLPDNIPFQIIFNKKRLIPF